MIKFIKKYNPIRILIIKNEIHFYERMITEILIRKSMVHNEDSGFISRIDMYNHLINVYNSTIRRLNKML